MTKNNVHLIADESLGGLTREYIEVDRKADVGNRIKVKFAEGVTDYRVGDTGTVKRRPDDIGVEAVKDGDSIWMLVFDSEYITLEPTDIVVHEGARYKLTDRKASVGEKVIVTDRWYDVKAGTILDIIDGADFGFDDDDCKDTTYYDSETNNRGRISYIDEEYYRVLVPVESIKEIGERTFRKMVEGKPIPLIGTDGPIEATTVEVTAEQASPAVIDMLGNLAVRIIELETKYKRALEENDTLHANQKRLGEELANLSARTPFDADEACGAIVELAKLLVESHRANAKEGVR